jgi:uncharacterized protein
MQIVPIYAAILAIFFVYLSFRTIKLRRRLKIGVGDGGNKLMLRAIRAHSNFAEYTPITLILLFLVESKGASPIFVYILCTAFLIARFVHAYGVSQESENFKYRIRGMMTTFAIIVLSALYLIVSSIF